MHTPTARLVPWPTDLDISLNAKLLMLQSQSMLSSFCSGSLSRSSLSVEQSSVDCGGGARMTAGHKEKLVLEDRT